MTQARAAEEATSRLRMVAGRDVGVFQGATLAGTALVTAAPPGVVLSEEQKRKDEEYEKSLAPRGGMPSDIRLELRVTATPRRRSMTTDRDRLRRPAGFASKGTFVGMLGCVRLTLSPLVTGISLIPVLRNGDAISERLLLPNLAQCVPLILILVFGLRKRRLWYERFVFWWGVAALVSYGADLLIGFTVLFRLVPEAHPELRFFLIETMIGWAVFTLFAY